MLLNIKGIDKVKLFTRLYNHIQENTGFGKPEAKLKSEEEARKLLIPCNFDYARFNLYCDINRDDVETGTFNALYGQGKSIFEDIVTALRKEMNPSNGKGIDNPAEGKPQDLNPPKSQSESLNLMLGQNGLQSLGSGMALGIGFQLQNWDRLGKLKDGQTIYFKQQSNSGSSYLNPTAGSCGFISLGTTREAVLKVLLESKNPRVQKLIIEQIELELLNSNLISPYTYSGDSVLSNRLKSAQRTASMAQEAVVKIQAALKAKYWAYTALERNASITDPANWYISPNEFLAVMQKLFTKQNTGLREFDVLEDVLKLTDALNNSEKANQGLEQILSDRKLMMDYLYQCIPTEWMGANIAMAWAIATKRTLRIWKHKDVLSKSDEIYLFRDTTEQLVGDDVRFKDQYPIDIIHTPTLIGAMENHYERLVKVDAPVHGLSITQPLVFSAKPVSSVTSGISNLVDLTKTFSGPSFRLEA